MAVKNFHTASKYFRPSHHSVAHFAKKKSSFHKVSRPEWVGYFISVKIPEPVKQLGVEECAAGCAAESVVRKSDKLYSLLSVLFEPSRRDPHPAVKPAVKDALRALLFILICNEMLGRARQGKLLRQSAKTLP